MISAPTLAADVVALSAIAGATYWVFRSQTELSTESKTAPVSGPIVGLQAPKQPAEDDSSSEASEMEQPIPSRYDLETVGVDINDFLDDTEGSEPKLHSDRVREEFEWAVASLLDLADCDAVAIIDAESKIVSSGGSLISDTTKCGAIVSQVTARRSREVNNVSGNTDLPFLHSEVRSYACLPIVDSGATLVLASKGLDFLDDKELRVATAVCNRLASFSFVSPGLPK